MSDKNKSFFTMMLNTVSSLSWLKGKGASSIKHMKPGKGFNRPVSNHAFDYIKELDDHEFDKLIVMLFKQRGYSVSTEEQHDSIDIVLKMNGEITFVQYRHWKKLDVDVALVEEFYAVMDAESAPHGIVITTGLFTEDALDYSHGKHLLLINGVDLSEMVGAMKESNDEHTKKEEPIDNAEEKMPELEPLCPICSMAMIKRTARKGKNAGNTFWGCSQFPNCRGVVSN